MESDWNALGNRRIKFKDGSYKNVTIAKFIHDFNGIPVVVEGADGSAYPWVAIISIGPVRATKGAY